MLIAELLPFLNRFLKSQSTSLQSFALFLCLIFKESQMQDFVINAPDHDRYTYFIAFYGKDYQKQTAVLYVQHNLSDSIATLHSLIRQRINSVLSKETPSCYHILALAAPEPMPCPT
jgi:hypothetical protein